MEIEVKFYFFEFDSLRKRLSALKARSRGKFFESNIRFEVGKSSLAQKNLYCDFAGIKKTP